MEINIVVEVDDLDDALDTFCEMRTVLGKKIKRYEERKAV